MNTLKTLACMVLICGSISICGCGGADPGSTVKDETPGGPATPTISMDPDEVAKQMDSGYAKENK